MNYPLLDYIAAVDTAAVPADRVEVLTPLVDLIKSRIAQQKPVDLVFICTHNSRRSALGQFWAQAMAHQKGVSIRTYSGGTEVTACNERTIAALIRAGVRIEGDMSPPNPHYQAFYDLDQPPLVLYSKLYDAPELPQSDFVAVMTCASADEGCPFIPGASARLPIRYEDPKAYDDTPGEADAYDERCAQIAAEMKFVFSSL